MVPKGGGNLVFKWIELTLPEFDWVDVVTGCLSNFQTGYLLQNIVALLFSLKGGLGAARTALKASQNTAVSLGLFLALLNLGGRGMRVLLLKKLKLRVCLLSSSF